MERLSSSDRIERSSTTLSKAMRIVRFLAHRDPMGAGVRTIARYCGMPPSTAHRLLQALLVEDMVVMEHGQRQVYRLGPLALGLGAEAHHHHFDWMRSIAKPQLQSLAKRFRCVAHLTVRVGRYGVCVERARAPNLQDRGRVGESTLLGAGGISLAILARLPADVAEEIAWENRWICLRTGVEPEAMPGLIDAAREQGYACSNTNMAPNVTCVAMSLADASRGELTDAAVGLYFSGMELPPRTVERAARSLALATRRIVRGIAASGVLGVQPR